MSQNINNGGLNLGALKKEFLEYLEIEKGRSLKTVENYDRYLTRFLKFLNAKEPSRINDEAVRRFRLWLNRKGLKRKTQNYYLIALRVFLKYLAKREVASLAPERIELAKVSSRELDLITEEELERLLGAPGDKDIRGMRDSAILELLFSTGLRVSELCALNRDDVGDAKNGEFSVRGKGEKIRVVFVSETAKKALKRYIDKRADTEEALFVKAPGGRPSAISRLTPRSIERIVKYYAIKAGISKKVTPHVIRHCFATDLLASGADIRSVQALLGHSSITTTQIYTHITNKRLRDVHEAFHGKRHKTK